MLKRYQIILEDWQADHYKRISEKYDVSFSEMVRMALCVDIMYATNIAFPKHKFSVELKTLHKTIEKKDAIKKIGMDTFHTFLSKLYFETRKATEAWLKH